MQRPRMGAKAAQGFAEFRSEYEEMMATGEGFLQEQVLRTWKMEKFARLKDHCVYYLYRNFPEIYQQVFVNEPVLPALPIWHYLTTHVFFLPEKWVNRFFWPKYGSSITAYLQYYMETLSQVLLELESTYEIILPQLDDDEGEAEGE